MTREELINYGEMFLEENKDSRNSNTYKLIDAAVKLFKQESVLDNKIRAEIKQYQSDYDVHGTEYDRTAWTAFNRCLQILDKYKAESGE